MRNLKKILAMVLALVMSLSLMATAGAAQFPDVDDSNPYKTAIDVLDELKVFQGFEDGTFKPTDTLNRAQAAVLVYRIATGDVENKYLDNYTYMQQSKFTDLDGYNWAKGYINYCQNAGIVVGTSATTFNPGAPVTGYQLMVMLLRTLGYGKAGEFTDPKGWELQTAAIAEREGILKNVTGGDFGAPAPRQMVAEILFRGILHDTVEYSPLTPGGYTESGVSLGKKTLGLDDIEGVVVANRIADLYDTEPMKDGQTRMIVDGKDYVIDMDTDASAIGLNHHAYVKDGKVLAGTLEAEGNVIGEPEHGEAAKVADLAKGAGIKLTKETEHYVNFDQYINGYSKWRLEYSVQFDDINDQAKFEARIGLDLDDVIVDGAHDGLDKVVNQGVDGAKYTRAIPRNRTITPQDITIMEGIFTYASGDTDATDFDVKGSVYAGTNNSSDANVNRNKDLAAVMTWDDFYDEYILGSKTEVTASDNGEWLRVIDNNGDGVAEYVLRTDFIMTTVVDYEKRTDLYNVEYDVDENHRVISKIPADEIRKDDDVDMSVGAVILYTYIDGYYYISNPEMKTLKVDTKSIEQKKNIFKSDDVEYTWSGIDKEAELYYTDISEISYDVNYDMYFDHFGFVRLATEARRNFVLLTDGYFKTDLRNHEWKVELYNGSEKVETADVVDGARNDSDWDNRRDDGYDGKIDGFIDTFEDDHQGNRGTWKRLNTFGEFYQQLDTTNNTVHYKDKNYKDAAGNTYTDGSLTVDRTTYYQDPFTTNIALASETDGVWTLQDVTDIDSEFNSLYRDYRVYELAGTDKAYDDGDSRIKQRSLKAKSTDLWGIEGNNVDRATRDTGWDNNAIDNLQAIQTNGSTLYYYVDGDGKVTSWVGYRNLPEGLENFAPARAYAVTHKVWADRDTDDTLDYEIADVVVFENNYSADVYDPQLITTGINTKRENALGKGSDGEYTEHGVAFGLFDRDELLARAENTVDDEGLWTPQLNFYASNVNKGEAPITENFAKYGIYAGQVIVADETKHNDYIEIGARDLNGDRISFYTDDVAAYEINRISKLGDEAAHNLEVETNNNIRLGDRLIVVLAGDDVKMVVNVSASGVDGKNLRDDGVAINKLVTLYDSINDEWADETAGKLEVKVAVKKGEEIITDAEPDITGLTKIDGKFYIANDAKETALTFKVASQYTVSSVTLTGNGTLNDMTPDDDGNVRKLLTGLDKDGDALEMTINLNAASYKIHPVRSKLGSANAVVITDANLKLDGAAWTANGPSVNAGTTVKVAFTVAGAVPVKVAVLDEDGVAVTGLDNLTFAATGTADEYEVSFQMPAQNIQILVNTKAGFKATLDPSSSGVTFDDVDVDAGDSLDAVSITLTPEAGKKVLAENVTIKMGDQTIGKSFYSVNKDTGAITWNTTGTYDASQILVTDDIVVTATATDPVRTITLNIQNDKDGAAVAGVAIDVNAEKEGNVYTVSQTDDVVLTITAKSAEALANGIEVLDGTSADMSPVAGVDGKTFTVEIPAGASNVVVNIKELVEITLDGATVTNNGLGEANTTFLVANGTELTVEGTCNAGHDKVEASDGDAGTGTQVSCTGGNFSIKITADGTATWTISTKTA